jgi:Uma2 family endonuclease
MPTTTPDAIEVTQIEPKPRLWTAEEFYRLVELNFFIDQRVELIGGEILQMAAQLNPHSLAITLTEDAMRKAFGPNHWVRVQMSLDLSPLSVPDPDIAVVPGAPRQYAGRRSNPTSALLIAEISETSLTYDLNRKASLYAASGIKDYWVVDLVHRQLEVHRRPKPNSKQPFGWLYDQVQILDPSDRIAPLASPKAKITVADLLP